MGVVWKAWDTTLHREVALKQVLLHGEGCQTEVERFLREAQLAAKLHHPSIVAVHDVGVQDGQHYFTADCIDGKPLSALMTEPVAPHQAAAWVRTVAEALAYAHDQGVVHRDVKPGNILVDTAMRPYVTDLGLAKEVELKPGTRDATLTQDGAILGTPHYMSPEQAGGETERVGRASDQFALGVVLYELLTGTRPFEGRTPFEIACRIIASEPTPPGSIRPGLHRDLETICLKALEKDPARRFGSMSEMSQDLGRYLAGEPVLARPISRAARWARRVRSHPAAALSVILVIVLLTVLGAGAASRLRSERQLDDAHRHARELKEAGRTQGARDAFQVVLTMDAGNEEAQRGIAWADEAVRRGAEETQRQRERAELAVRKAALVANVMVRWEAQIPAIRRMEAIKLDPALGPDEKAVRIEDEWKTVDRFMRETPNDPTSRAAMLGVAGWARHVAGHAAEAAGWFQEARSLDPEVPHAAITQAMMELGLFVNGLANRPRARTREEVLEGLAPAWAETLGRIRPLLHEAEQASVWGSEMVTALRTYIAALEAFAQGRYDESVAGLTSVETCPGLLSFRETILQARAAAHLGRGDFAGAYADMEEAMRLNPNPAELPRWRAQVAQEAGNLRQALVHYDEAIAIEPSNPSLLCDRGSARGLHGDADGAIDDFSRACHLAPRFARPWALRGLSMFRKGDSKAALRDYDEAIRLDPSDTDTLVARAIARHASGDPDGSIEDCDRAIALKPNHARAFAARGFARKARGDLDGAIQDYDRALQANPSYAEVYNNRGRARHGKKDYEGAIRDFDAAVRILPDYPEAIANRGVTKEETGDLAGALADYEQALKIAPTSWVHRERVVARRDKARAALKDAEE